MMRSRDELACLGGPRSFSSDVHVGRPNVPETERLLSRMREVLESRWLTNDGPFVRRFEAKVRELTGVRHCVAVCNGTLGLELAVRATGMVGEVIVPSYTFVATPHSLAWQGLRPRFADVEPGSHTIAVESLERAITSDTTGIVATHLWGRVCDVAALGEFAAARGLHLIFDAAHAFGVRRGGIGVGNFGECEVFSFHATKFINSFEGGAVTTNSDEIADRLRSMRNFGFVGLDAVTSVGTNAKMSEVSAAMGLSSLEDIDELIEANRERSDIYRKALAGVPGLSLLVPAADEESNFQYVVALIDSSAFHLTRDELAQALWAEGVLARRYFYPGCHRMKAYRRSVSEGELRLPVTDRLSAEVLVLPTGPTLRPEEIGKIAGLILAVHRRAGEVRAALSGRDDAWTVAHRRSFEMLAEVEAIGGRPLQVGPADGWKG